MVLIFIFLLNFFRNIGLERIALFEADAQCCQFEENICFISYQKNVI